MGCTFLLWSPAWLAYGAADLVYPPTQGYASSRAIFDALCLKFGLGIGMAVLGALALWPKLRRTVHARLASIGEGVATAAGIAALLGARDSAQILALAQSTFRSVSIDKLEPKHLASNTPAADAFAISIAAPLGSIDVRVRDGARRA